VSTLTTIFDNIRSIVASVGIADILDIAIVVILIYAILSAIRTSSALRIASAIVVFLLVTWLTGVAKMRVLNFILTNILEIGIIALVIVFQPELRRLLENVGSRSLLMLTNRSSKINVTEETIAKTVSACEILSRERTGVLLVFERSLPLDDYFKSGTLLDAALSTELLRNLFFTKASLHDGAVIVRKDRIAAAGCVLPLTENPTISRELGTRHRAAIGISESTDAIALIASEETGILSMARDGKLTRYLDANSLNAVLSEMYAPAQDSANLLNRLFRKEAQK